jgi:exodeoxyribonuclease-5
VSLDGFDPPNLEKGDRFNRRDAQFEYAYAMTCHKSQGSEWPRVLVYSEAFGEDWERRAWLYTAITRASRKLILAV